VSFDGRDYVVVWQDNRGGSWDIYGARVSLAGVVTDVFPAFVSAKDQTMPALAHGQGGQLLLICSGWADSINYRQVNTIRAWGKLSPLSGREESDEPRVVHGYGLDLSPNPFRQMTQIKFSTWQSAKGMKLSIYDIAGRLVKDFSLSTTHSLLPTTVAWDGTDNSEHRLSAGVYFCRLDAGDISITKKIVKLK
jgi:hypothetical protein